MQDITVTAISGTGWRKALQNAENERARSLRLWTSLLIVAAMVGSAAGIAGIVIGILFAIGVEALATSTVGNVGTLLIIVSIGSLVTAAHCIDVLDEKDKAARVEYCIRRGLARDDPRD